MNVGETVTVVEVEARSAETAAKRRMLSPTKNDKLMMIAFSEIEIVIVSEIGTIEETARTEVATIDAIECGVDETAVEAVAERDEIIIKGLKNVIMVKDKDEILSNILPMSLNDIRRKSNLAIRAISIFMRKIFRHRQLTDVFIFSEI